MTVCVSSAAGGYMQRLDWYILRVISTWFFIIMTILVSFRAIGFLVRETGDIGQGDYQLIHVLFVTLMRLPGFIGEIFPAAVLFGGLMGLGGLARKHELMAMRAAGVSIGRLVKSLVKTGLILAIGGVLVGEIVAPALEQESEMKRADWLHQQTILQSKNGVWIRDANTYVNIRRINPERNISDIAVYSFADDGVLKMMQSATGAKYDGKQWILQDVSELQLGDKENTLVKLSHQVLGLDLKMGLLLNLGVDPAFLSMTELFNYISFLHDNEQRSPEYEVVFWSKMVVPVLSVLLLLLSLPFVIKDIRNADMGKHLIVGAITGVLFFLVSKTAGFAGVVYDVSPLLVAWMPVLLIAAATAWLYRRLA
ncbi:MAG TPA: LPS export ABC transporter permease LptG [Gammaproteobacteria bacterium]|nr:LPS export ABC transporter permease LptG [Gammaproteobacteria bacterium]